MMVDLMTLAAARAGGGGGGGNSGMHVVSIVGVSTEIADELEFHYEKSNFEETAKAVNDGKVVTLHFEFNSGEYRVIGNTSLMMSQQVDGRIFGVVFYGALETGLLGFLLNMDGSIAFNPISG